MSLYYVMGVTGVSWVSLFRTMGDKKVYRSPCKVYVFPSTALMAPRGCSYCWALVVQF